MHHLVLPGWNFLAVAPRARVRGAMSCKLEAEKGLLQFGRFSVFRQSRHRPPRRRAVGGPIGFPF